jgi:hypothetical protein
MHKVPNHFAIKMKTEQDVIIKVITTKNGLADTEIYDNSSQYKGRIAEYGIIYKKGEFSVKYKFVKKNKFDQISIDNAIKKCRDTYNRDFNGKLHKHPSDDLIEYDEDDKLD